MNTLPTNEVIAVLEISLPPMTKLENRAKTMRARQEEIKAATAPLKTWLKNNNIEIVRDAKNLGAMTVSCAPKDIAKLFTAPSVKNVHVEEEDSE